MANEVISYMEMCLREKTSLQAGMNFGLGGNHSVILMSIRPNAPYHDRFEDDGSTIIYEGHDEPRSATTPLPKTADQPEFKPNQRHTQNGLFHNAANQFKKGFRPPERVRVYEKLRPGMWSYNGIFHLVDSWREQTGGRHVFRFKLTAVEASEDLSQPVVVEAERRRIIPTPVKLEVWKRDGGRCIVCGAADDLHFDHVVPFARGGSSRVAENIQLLCARHNLKKSDNIV